MNIKPVGVTNRLLVNEFESPNYVVNTVKYDFEVALKCIEDVEKAIAEFRINNGGEVKCVVIDSLTAFKQRSIEEDIASCKEYWENVASLHKGGTEVDRWKKHFPQNIENKVDFNREYLLNVGCIDDSADAVTNAYTLCIDYAKGSDYTAFVGFPIAPDICSPEMSSLELKRRAELEEFSKGITVTKLKKRNNKNYAKLAGYIKRKDRF